MNIFDKFRSRFPVDDAQWELYKSYYQRMEVPAKTILLEEGEISRRALVPAGSKASDW